MVVILAAAIVAAAVVWSAAMIAGAMKRSTAAAVERQSLALMTLFAPGLAAAIDDPRALLAWQPLAAAARRIFPEAFAALDRASGGAFPFSDDQIQTAHARWTADWLAWERTHDGEYKLKAKVAEAEREASGGGALASAQVEAVEREKLERYQQRYAEYVRISKALQGLMTKT